MNGDGGYRPPSDERGPGLCGEGAPIDEQGRVAGVTWWKAGVVMTEICSEKMDCIV